MVVVKTQGHSLGKGGVSVDLSKVHSKLVLHARGSDLQHPGGRVEVPFNFGDAFYSLKEEAEQVEHARGGDLQHPGGRIEVPFNLGDAFYSLKEEAEQVEHARGGDFQHPGGKVEIPFNFGDAFYSLKEEADQACRMPDAVILSTQIGGLSLL